MYVRCGVRRIFGSSEPFVGVRDQQHFKIEQTASEGRRAGAVLLLLTWRLASGSLCLVLNRSMCSMLCQRQAEILPVATRARVCVCVFFFCVCVCVCLCLAGGCRAWL